MTRVVESVAPDFSESMTWDKVVTRELKGALRFGELSKTLGRPAPVPSIFINGVLVFEQTPGLEELRDCLEKSIEGFQQDKL